MPCFILSCFPNVSGLALHQGLLLSLIHCAGPLCLAYFSCGYIPDFTKFWTYPPPLSFESPDWPWDPALGQADDLCTITWFSVNKVRYTELKLKLKCTDVTMYLLLRLITLSVHFFSLCSESVYKTRSGELVLSF